MSEQYFPRSMAKITTTKDHSLKSTAAVLLLRSQNKPLWPSFPLLQAGNKKFRHPHPFTLEYYINRIKFWHCMYPLILICKISVVVLVPINKNPRRIPLVSVLYAAYSYNIEWVRQRFCLTDLFLQSWLKRRFCS